MWQGHGHGRKGGGQGGGGQSAELGEGGGEAKGPAKIPLPMDAGNIQGEGVRNSMPVGTSGCTYQGCAYPPERGGGGGWHKASVSDLIDRSINRGGVM